MIGRHRVGAVIVAAGASARLGVDKMFVGLGGMPVLARTMACFEASVHVDEIILVMSQANLDRGKGLVRDFSLNKVSTVCVGGARRQDSVQIGLSELDNCRWVIIHDGARPFVDERMIEEGLDHAARVGAAVAAVPVKDTIKVVGDQRFVRSTPDRDTLWAAQTPQVFRFDLIVEAFHGLARDVTDDAQAVELKGLPVAVYMGAYENIKVTTPEDLELAELICRRRSAKV